MFLFVVMIVHTAPSMTCLLQHMKSDRSNRLKCPMCMEFIFHNELKPVVFEESLVVENPTAVSTRPKLITNDNFTFRHLLIDKGRITPLVYQSTGQPLSLLEKRASPGPTIKFSEHLQHLAGIIPEETSDLAKFCRVVFRNVSSMRECFAADKQQLLQLKYQIIRESISGLDEIAANGLVAVDDALQLVTEHESKFETDVTRFDLDCVDFSPSAIASSSTSSSSSSTQRLPTTPTLEATLARTRGANSKPKPPTNNNTNSNHRNHHLKGGRASSSSPAMLTSAPLLPMTEEEELQLALAISASLNIAKCEQEQAPLITATVTASPKRQRMDTQGTQNHVFQCRSGSLVFLHPLCTQCLLEQSMEDQKVDTELQASFPEHVTGKIVDVERLRLDNRNNSSGIGKFNFLKFLPDYTEVFIVEIDMKPLVSKSVLSMFKDEFAKRVNKRREKKKVEEHERKLSEAKRYSM
jgi:hypothetical protein